MAVLAVRISGVRVFQLAVIIIADCTWFSYAMTSDSIGIFVVAQVALISFDLRGFQLAVFI